MENNPKETLSKIISRVHGEVNGGSAVERTLHILDSAPKLDKLVYINNESLDALSGFASLIQIINIDTPLSSEGLDLFEVAFRKFLRLELTLNDVVNNISTEHQD